MILLDIPNRFKASPEFGGGDKNIFGSGGCYAGDLKNN
jgi:hypothetical protein